RRSSGHGRARTNQTSATCSIASRTCSDSAISVGQPGASILPPMTRFWPALDIYGLDPHTSDFPGDFVLALVDEFAPTAAEARPSLLRIIFGNDRARQDARTALAAHPNRYDARIVDVPDGDWARRSQKALGPVTVGRITILPDSRAYHS